MNQNYYNNVDVPQVVDNIMNNIDTFSNTNSNNYVPINNLTYNPNVFEPYGQSPINQHQNMNQYNMQQPTMNNYNMNNGMNQYNMNSRNMNSQNMNQRINQYNMDPRILSRKKQKKVLNNIENLDNTSNSKLFSVKSLRYLLIYTVLFIIFSHSKMTDIICKLIPNSISMISNIPCITIKGLLMGVIIIIVNRYL